MKNLKKVLALALSATMALSMFVSAGAAYTDAADIKALGAVDMLTALGVINGNPDGSFKPDGTVTRAEMAKMIFTVRNGGNSDATGYESMPSTFTDIKTHWAAGYIKYCQSIGIIAGKSATKFAPDELVTGSEAAKMLLVCAGYTADKAGLIGSTWENKTLALATENELLLDVNSPVSSGLPRQYAAQIVYNALDMETVVYSKDIEGFKPAGDVSDRSTVGRKYMNLVKADAGKLLSVTKVDGKDYYTIKVEGTSKQPATSYTKVPTDVSSLLGQNIKVLVKDKTTASDVYGVYADEDSKVLATGFAADFKTDGTDKVKLNGTSYKLDGTTAMSAYAMNDDTNKKALTALADQTKMNDVAASIKLIDNNSDGKVDSVVYTPVKFGQVTSVGKTSITVNNSVGTKKFDDAKIYDGVAKNDFVLFTDAKQFAEDKDVITKLDVTNDKVAATRGSAGKFEVKIGDTWYKLASDMKDHATENLTTGSTYDFVKAGGFILNAEEASASAKDILFVSAKGDYSFMAGDKDGKLKVRAYFVDGTNKEIEVSKWDGLKVTNGTTTTERKNHSEIAQEMLYTYSKLSDDTYDIKPMSSSNKAGYDTFNTVSTNAYSKQKIGGMALNDDAVVFVKGADATKVLSGKQIKNWADATLNFSGVYATKENNGINYIQVASLVSGSIDVPGATKDTKYGYLTADPYQSTQNGDKKATYEVWTSEGAKTLYADKSNETSTVLKAGAIMAYNENGSYIDVKGKVGVNAAITGIRDEDKGSVSFKMKDDSGNTIAHQYDMDEDCVVFAVKDADKEGMEGGRSDVQLAQPNDKSGTKVVANAYVVVNDEDKIVAIVYDGDKNEIRGGDTAANWF